jgi:MFS family permease
MAVSMALMGLVSNAFELVGLRLLTGLLGGYSSGSMILVAAQAPRERSGWALGIVSSGIMAGNLVGPLAGGILPPLIGVRATFLAASALIFSAFLATVFFLHGDHPARADSKRVAPSTEPNSRGRIAVLLITGALLMVANLSVEPILSIYVASFGVDPRQTTIWAGLTLSATALGSLLSAAVLGRWADRVGTTPVLVGGLAAASLLVVPQVFVTAAWQLLVVRFLMGCALGGLLPCIAKGLRQSVPADRTGRMLGLSISAQYAGQVVGPLAGGWFAGIGGIPMVLWGTSALLFLGAALNLSRPTHPLGSASRR